MGALTQQEQRDGPSSRNGSRLEAQAAPISITITRAVNLHVHDAGLTTTIETTAANLQDALHNAGIKIYDADLVRPPLSTAVVPEQHVFIQRAKAVTVSSDDPELTPGGTLSTRSRQATVGGLLEEQRLAVTARDRIDPALSAPLRHGAEVNIKRFREVSIAVDGETINTRSKRTTVAELLADEGIKLGKHDVVEPALDSLIEQEMEVGIARFRGVVLKIDGREIEKVAASETVGDLLEEAGVVMGHLDIVEPSPDTPLSEGLEVVVTRLYGVTIKADGAAWETITRRNTVREVIRDEELALDDDDEIYPEMDAGIEDGSVIRIVRVRQGIVEEEVAIPFERAGDEPDAEMEAGEEYYTGGEPGLLYRRVHVVYRDGEESLRETVESKVLRDPVPQVRHYGTKVTRKYVDTPLGPRYYSRVVRCYATYYHDSTSSKLPGDPTWGITRTGTRTRPGTVAVDPDVIPLWSELYITDYGFGTALDTGGAVVGNLIDIWMPEGESWWVPHYVDVYILE